jgi:hypothetical protein
MCWSWPPVTICSLHAIRTAGVAIAGVGTIFRLRELLNCDRCAEIIWHRCHVVLSGRMEMSAAQRSTGASSRFGALARICDLLVLRIRRGRCHISIFHETEVESTAQIKCHSQCHALHNHDCNNTEHRQTSKGIAEFIGPDCS